MTVPHISEAAAQYLADRAWASPADLREALLAGEEPGPILGDPDNHEGILGVEDL